MNAYTPDHRVRPEHKPLRSDDAWFSLLAERIAEQPTRGSCKLVAIDGRGCAGKSSLAEKLVYALSAGWTGSDDFFLVMPESDEASLELNKQYRLTEMADLLKSLLEIGSGQYAPFNWKEMTIASPIHAEQKSVYIVEGLGVLSPLFEGLYDFSIWVEGSLHDRLARVAKRDGTKYLAHWQDVLHRRELHYLKSYRPWLKADVIVCGAGARWSDVSFQMRRYSQ